MMVNEYNRDNMDQPKQINIKNAFTKALFFGLPLAILVSCQLGVPTSVPGVSTWTPSATATPTCAPNIQLSTPEGWDTSSRLFIILFDPQSIGGQYLEFANGERTQDISYFINSIIPKLVKPGDQISGFQLGYKAYETARLMRVFSYISPPQLYNTPSPKETLTPHPTLAGTQQPGLVGIATANAVKTQQVASTRTSLANDAIYACEKIYWNNDAKLTATAWKQVETVEVGNIGNQMTEQVTTFEANKYAIETPFTDAEVYYGLAHASTDIKSDCKKYDKCILIIIDDLLTWGINNPNNLEIDLSGVNVYAIMPNCRDINQPSCTKIQDYWDIEFEKFGSGKPVYFNGIHVEADLLNAIGR